jgi:hypothetical protein
MTRHQHIQQSSAQSCREYNSAAEIQLLHQRLSLPAKHTTAHKRSEGTVYRKARSWKNQHDEVLLHGAMCRAQDNHAGNTSTLHAGRADMNNVTGCCCLHGKLTEPSAGSARHPAATVWHYCTRK